MSRPTGLKRLRKVGMIRRVESSEDQESLAVTTAVTTTTTTRLKARGIVVPDPNQITFDEQIIRDIQAKLDAELIEEQKLTRKQEEEANIALIESWENIQAMMEADRLLAERLQSRKERK
ncbi:hypothetical protein Tco_0678376 [Tanacetum coccineum]|uniref:Uncharacterized protein n=1 Tax=Tanacetum coccineum TaxID=301880 RepID=A0ABQ4XEW2_9ASTR